MPAMVGAGEAGGSFCPSASFIAAISCCWSTMISWAMRILAMTKFRHRHVDGALMVGDHHGGEIGIDIARGFHRHARHHTVHRGFVFRQVCNLLGKGHPRAADPYP